LKEATPTLNANSKTNTLQKSKKEINQSQTPRSTPNKTKASLEENSSFETDQHPKTRRCLTTKKLKGTSFFNDHLLK